ncbi:hypothetical protein [Parahaliea aestuarii]|uniref:Carboxypeptidase regulatory-like domain-containing protein n=1 Tax=Parahaliea aestuarii TaxID=1852021 RepID=A0A5C9A6U7_9GAMM|nr:hypothetical protein [Parahaliea aestuarii]TXS94921.1 hypothetical protein FVW59_03190 [Parahaliea aestuarii]
MTLLIRISAVALMLVVAFIALVFLVIPAFRHQDLTPVYATEFASKVTTASAPSINEGIGGVVTVAGKGTTAMLRVYNRPRKERFVDVVTTEFTELDGRFELALSPGDYQLLVSKGPEFEFVFHDFSVNAGESINMDIDLVQLVDMTQRGWFAGDPHQHSAFADGKDAIDDLLRANAAVGLHWSVQTDHNVVGQNPVARQAAIDMGLEHAGHAPYHTVGGDEVTTRIGHMIVWEPLNPLGEYEHIDHETPGHDDPLEERLDAIHRIAHEMREMGQFQNINHPHGGSRAYEAFGDNASSTWGDMNLDWVRHKETVLQFDATEGWNGGSGFMQGGIYYFGSRAEHPFEAMERVFHQWYRLLNTGAKFPSLGSSDTHDTKVAEQIAGYNRLSEGVKEVFFGLHPYLPQGLAYALTDDVPGALMYQHLDFVENQLEDIALMGGSPRTYVYTGGELTTEKLAQNMAHSFVTSGPLLLAQINGAMPGETALPQAQNTLELDIVSHKPLSRLMVVVDGELAVDKRYDHVMHIKDSLALDIRGKKWAIVYVEGENNYAYAYTNPIYFH